MLAGLGFFGGFLFKFQKKAFGPRKKMACQQKSWQFFFFRNTFSKKYSKVINISERELILVGKRHTSNALFLGCSMESNLILVRFQRTEKFCLLRSP